MGLWSYMSGLMVGFVMVFFITRAYFMNQDKKKKQEELIRLDGFKNETEFHPVSLCRLNNCKFFGIFFSTRMGREYVEIVPCVGCIHFQKKDHYSPVE